MRKLDLSDYTVKRKTPDKANPFNEIEIELPYRVKDSILNLMFVPQLQLSGAELVKQNALALKIEACKEGEILLEEAEYERVKKALSTFKGFTRDDVELVTRIMEAPEP